ncbi:unnamed protein product [Boreogadus saida]
MWGSSHHVGLLPSCGTPPIMWGSSHHVGLLPSVISTWAAAAHIAVRSSDLMFTQPATIHPPQCTALGPGAGEPSGTATLHGFWRSVGAGSTLPVASQHEETYQSVSHTAVVYAQLQRTRDTEEPPSPGPAWAGGSRSLEPPARAGLVGFQVPGAPQPQAGLPVVPGPWRYSVQKLKWAKVDLGPHKHMTQISVLWPESF